MPIKTDLENFVLVELEGKKQELFSHQDKIKNIIENLYKTKNVPEKMTGWLMLPYHDELFNNIKDFTEKISEEKKYEHLLVLGIGGSSLGAQALLDGINTPFWNRLSKGKRKTFLTVDFIDNLDPLIIRNLLTRLKLNKTLFMVVSKAGGTVETIAPMLILKEWLGDDFYKQAIFVTTEGKGLLYEIGKKNNVRLFYIPENVGGRFSVFSPVGLIPAALSGLDIDAIKKGIIEADINCQNPSLLLNVAAQIANVAYISYLNKKNILAFMPYSTSLRKFVDWFIQLWAESIGKNSKGSTPIPAIGATDQHSQIQLFNEGPNDKLIGFLKIKKHKKDLKLPDFSNEHENFSIYKGHKVGEILNIELEATKKALTEHGKANFTIIMPELNEYYLSKLMYILEMSTAIMGHLLEVNPFDQPGVELGKKYIKEMLSI